MVAYAMDKQPLQMDELDRLEQWAQAWAEEDDEDNELPELLLRLLQENKELRLLLVDSEDRVNMVRKLVEEADSAKKVVEEQRKLIKRAEMRLGFANQRLEEIKTLASRPIYLPDDVPKSASQDRSTTTGDSPTPQRWGSRHQGG